MHTYTPDKSTFSTVHLDINPFACSHERGAKNPYYYNDFRSGTVIGRFLSDGAASMAVKGLTHNAEYRIVPCHIKRRSAEKKEEKKEEERKTEMVAGFTP